MRCWHVRVKPFQRYPEQQTINQIHLYNPRVPITNARMTKATCERSPRIKQKKKRYEYKNYGRVYTMQRANNKTQSAFAVDVHLTGRSSGQSFIEERRALTGGRWAHGAHPRSPFTPRLPRPPKSRLPYSSNFTYSARPSASSSRRPRALASRQTSRGRSAGSWRRSTFS